MTLRKAPYLGEELVREMGRGQKDRLPPRPKAIKLTAWREADFHDVKPRSKAVVQVYKHTP